MILPTALWKQKASEKIYFTRRIRGFIKEKYINWDWKS